MNEPMPLARAARLLRAKAAETENRYTKGGADSYADIALVATLLAELIEFIVKNESREGDDGPAR